MRRILTLQEIGVKCLLRSGQTTIPGPFKPLRIVGKGHSSTVVAGVLGRTVIAIKSRRVDSKRDSLASEASLLAVAGTAGVAPRVYGWSDDLIVMDLVSGYLLDDIINKNLPSKETLRIIVREVLEAAYILDTLNVLHRELSRPHRHVIFSSRNIKSKALIIDFESASKGKCGNLNRVASYFMRRYPIRHGDLPGILREYKRSGCSRDMYRRVVDILVSSFL